MSRRAPRFLLPSTIGWPLVILVALAGCTTQSKSNARARAAFVAGQRQAMLRAMQPQEPSVRVNGNVKNPVIPWTEELTVARAVIAAGYSGHRDPRVILIVRNGQEIQLDPGQLLRGEDVPLQSGDVVEIRE